MSIDVKAAREDTRGTGHVTHLNNAGSSLAPHPVMDTVVGHLRREEEIGGYEAAAEAEERIASVYSSLARLIGATPGEVAVLESGSTAWAAVVSRLPLTGRRILLGRTEYWHNVLVLRQLARRDGLELVVLDDDAHGQVDVKHLQRELDRGGAGMVALTHVLSRDGFSGGLIVPLRRSPGRCGDDSRRPRTRSGARARSLRAGAGD